MSLGNDAVNCRHCSSLPPATAARSGTSQSHPLLSWPRYLLRRVRGSSASRNPSPKNVNESMSSAMSTVGKIDMYQ